MDELFGHIFTKSDCNQPINWLNINIFQNDQLNIKSKLKVYILCNL